jgi:translation initiation factor 2B subunit (eIF-2B alpha/beta/delta family)
MSKNKNEVLEYWRSQVEILKNDFDHGSIYIAKESLKIITEFVEKQIYQNRTELIQALSKLTNALVRAKPLKALVYNYAHQIINFIQDIPREERDVVKIKCLTLDFITNILREANIRFTKVNRLGARLILDQHIILTHSASSNIEGILKEAKRLKRRFKVICTESRPRLEGQKFARSLIKSGIKTKLIPDSDISRAVKEAHFVMTGTERITENTFVNKTGTTAIAIIAKEYDKPFYIAANTNKILLKRTYPVRFNSVNESELMAQNHDHLTIQNIYFEEIPLDFVHKFITENSIFERDEFIERLL